MKMSRTETNEEIVSDVSCLELFPDWHAVCQCFVCERVDARLVILVGDGGGSRFVPGMS